MITEVFVDIDIRTYNRNIIEITISVDRLDKQANKPFRYDLLRSYHKVPSRFINNTININRHIVHI